MRLPAPAQQIVTQMFNRFATLPWLNDATRRAFTVKCCEQLKFTFPNEGYGAKRASPSRPLSKDCIAKLGAGTLIGWDFINGTTGRLQFHEHLDLAGQVYVPVTATDHLGSSAPVPSPTPIPTPDPASLEEVIANQERILDLLGKLAGIEHETLQTALRSARIENNQYKPQNVSMRVPFLGGNASGVVDGVVRE